MNDPRSGEFRDHQNLSVFPLTRAASNAHSSKQAASAVLANMHWDTIATSSKYQQTSLQLACPAIGAAADISRSCFADDDGIPDEAILPYGAIGTLQSAGQCDLTALYSHAYDCLSQYCDGLAEPSKATQSAASWAGVLQVAAQPDSHVAAASHCSEREAAGQQGVISAANAAMGNAGLTCQTGNRAASLAVHDGQTQVYGHFDSQPGFAYDRPLGTSAGRLLRSQHPSEAASAADLASVEAMQVVHVGIVSSLPPSVVFVEHTSVIDDTEASERPAAPMKTRQDEWLQSTAALRGTGANCVYQAATACEGPGLSAYEHHAINQSTGGVRRAGADAASHCHSTLRASSSGDTAGSEKPGSTSLHVHTLPRSQSICVQPSADVQHPCTAK